MADSNFPTSIDTAEVEASLAAGTLADIDGTTKPHSSWMRRVAHALNRLQAKVGVDGSAVTTSHDYKIAQLESSRATTAALAAHEADTTAVHGITDTSALLVSSGTPGGELGGTWASPTVDATHSGSSHAGTQAAAEATAASALAAHVAAGDPHVGYLLESAADEVAQDAVGAILTDSATIDFTYNDGTPSITASIIAGSVGPTELTATAVTPGSYGTASAVPSITVDADGRITAASTNAIADSPSILILSRAFFK